MSESAFAGSGVLLGLVAATAGALAVAGALHLTARRGEGFFQYFSYPVLLSVGVLVFSSGRTPSSTFEMQNSLLAESNPISTLTSRLDSSFLVLASVVGIISYFRRRNRFAIAPYWLLFTFVAFWCTTVASPALFGARGSFVHDYLYTLAMGCAAIVSSQRESDATIAAVRNSVLVFLAINVALIPMRPTLVIDSDYAAGLFPLPRFAGLTPDPVALGMLAQLALLCLYARPVTQRWLNGLCWVLGLFALFLTQAKMSWLSFPICLACMFWLCGDLRAWHRFGGPHQKLSALLIPLISIVVVVGLGLTYLFGDLGSTIDSFFTGQRAADLASFTGRDQAWAVALAEWARHPAFGYGSNLFDEAFRAEIGMPFAVHAHNQFIDTLARSGLVGAAGLASYAATLLVMSVKHARASRGLSLALFLALVFQSVTEIPLQIFRYGPNVLQQFLLLAILAGQVRNDSALSASQSATQLR